MRKITPGKLSPDVIYASRLGLTLRELVNKCRPHPELAPLGSLALSILQKLKNEVTVTLFGEEEQRPKLDADEPRNARTTPKAAVGVKPAEPAEPPKPKAAESKDTRDQPEVKPTQEIKPLPPKSSDKESEDPALKNPCSPSLGDTICEKFAKLLEEVSTNVSDIRKRI